MIPKNSYFSNEVQSNSAQARRALIEQNQQPDPKAQITVSNVKKYVTAEMSLQLYGPVTDSEFNKRADQCRGCDQRFDSKDIADEIGFCRGCGCGVSARSKLSIKLTMPEATCPKNKWQKAIGRHAKLSDRVKSWVLRRLLG